jgi:hypothetical protein
MTMDGGVWMLIVAVVSLIVFDLLALRFGTDSRHKDGSRNWW